MYAGPEQSIPLASLLAMIFGLLLSFWSKSLVFFRKVIDKVKRPTQEPAESSQPPGSSDANLL